MSRDVRSDKQSSPIDNTPTEKEQGMQVEVMKQNNENTENTAV